MIPKINIKFLSPYKGSYSMPSLKIKLLSQNISLYLKFLFSENDGIEYEILISAYSKVFDFGFFWVLLFTPPIKVTPLKYLRFFYPDFRQKIHGSLQLWKK
jgi:hypothetical protein